MIRMIGWLVVCAAVAGCESVGTCVKPYDGGKICAEGMETQRECMDAQGARFEASATCEDLGFEFRCTEEDMGGVVRDIYTDSIETCGGLLSTPTTALDSGV